MRDGVDRHLPRKFDATGSQRFFRIRQGRRERPTLKATDSVHVLHVDAEDACILLVPVRSSRAMSMPFRHRLDTMVAELRAHPRIEVHEYVIQPPALEDDIAAAEEVVGMRLPADVREFYLAHNGIFLLWGLRGVEYRDRPGAFTYPDYGCPPGCINFVSVREAMSPHWQEEYHVNEIDSDHQELLFGAPHDPPLEVDAVCVDNYSKYHHGDLIFGPDPVMVVCTDHGADMDSSDFCSFSVYLDVVLANFGTCRYREGLGIGWTRSPERVTAWTRKRSLDEIVAAIDEDNG